MSNFGSYPGKDFLALKLEPREWLIENIIRQGDSVILVGNEKSGKSLFIFQLICSLTSGQPFLDLYNITHPCKVEYFQLEGEISDSQDRMLRMIKTQELNPDLFTLNFFPPLEMDNKAVVDNIRERIEKRGKPDVIIIDPIYFAFTGSLNNDEEVRRFIGNMRILKDALGCAIILVHHTHRQKWSTDGMAIDEGDDALFGSKFLKAWADHILMFMYDKRKNLRSLSCTTQRSGDIVKQCNIRLIEPVPLYFEAFDKAPTNEFFILNLLNSEMFKDGLTMDELVKRLGITKNSLYASLKPLLAQEVIIKSDSRPSVYRYNWEKFNASKNT